MKLDYDYFRSLLLINHNLSKDLFLEKIGTNRGYSLNVFSRIYDCIFSELIDIEKEYMKYYSFEYNTLELFLWKKYNLKIEDIKRLIEEREKNPECGIFRTDDGSYGDYGLAQFIFSETMNTRIMDILMLKGKSK